MTGPKVVNFFLAVVTNPNMAKSLPQAFLQKTNKVRLSISIP
jgi:hypothetical protein